MQKWNFPPKVYVLKRKLALAGGIKIFNACTHTMFNFSNVIASELTSNSYSFIFGCDMFIALVLETGLTLIVADEHGLALDIRYQVTYLSHTLLQVNLFIVYCIQRIFYCPRYSLCNSIHLDALTTSKFEKFE
jgi:hypothetical protein